MKQLPRFIEKCLPQLLSSKDIFYWIAPYYEQRLASWRYNEKLTYQQQGENKKTLGKFENAMLYGLTHPAKKSLKANVSKYFFRLLKNIFPPNHKLQKNFKKNTLKLSYFCMTNLKAKIDGHNKKTRKRTASQSKVMQLSGKRKLPNETRLSHWNCFILRWNKLWGRKSYKIF